MPKLQKRVPPPYVGTSTSEVESGLGSGGRPYESFPQDTLPPVPLNESYHQVAVSGALASRHSQHEESAATPVSVSLSPNTNFSRPSVSGQNSNQPPQQQGQPQQLVSPVSPLLDPMERSSRVSMQPATEIRVPQPKGRSVDLRRLDGSPYATDRLKQVNVAQDMHEGCGRRKLQGAATGSLASSAPLAQAGTRSSALLAQARPYVAPPGAASAQGPHPTSSATIAGPSSLPSGISQASSLVVGVEQHVHVCHKCGKRKKPAGAGLAQPAYTASSSLQRPAQAGLRIVPSISVGRPQQIDIAPASGASLRPMSLVSAATTFNDGAPLIAQHAAAPGRARASQFSGVNIFRNNSLIRSLSRRMSSRTLKRESEGPLPSQQLRSSNEPDSGTPGNLINMISNAIKESGEDNKVGPSYQRLSVADPPDRPASPFSFMSVVHEDDGYEMVQLGDEKEKKHKARDSDSTAVASRASQTGKKLDGSVSASSAESLYSPEAVAETMDADVDRRSQEIRKQAERRQAERRSARGDLLAIPEHDGGARPQITRFKSLRNGVNRVASISRETSLKRLDSLKRLHTNWYRDDMAIEGHNGESRMVGVGTGMESGSLAIGTVDGESVPVSEDELQFAKQFLTTLDNKSTKYQPDHVFFPSNASELRTPYTLPRLPHPPHPNPPSQAVSLPTSSSSNAADSSSASSARLVTIRLNSSRNPTMSLTLHSLPLSTPVAELKSAIRTHLGGGSNSGGPSTDKIKILLNKKPIPSTKKTLADAFEAKEGTGQQKVEEGEEQVTLSVMVMGGAPDPPADAPPNSSNGSNGSNSNNWQDQLEQPAFWDDLQVFLQQRLHDREGGKKLRAIIEKAWRADVVRIAT
ncbi:hypothetical protein DV737_g2474, partial [Chaetothyriales sp. CBS 132003]